MKTSGGRNTLQVQLTAGKFLDDGSLLEVIQDPSSSSRVALLYWDGEHSHVADRFELNGQIYSPVDVSENTLRAINFPSQEKHYGSPTELVARVVAVLERYSAFSERDLRLLAYFVLSTWMADALPSIVSLLVSNSSAVQTSQFFRLFRCLCRRAVRVAGINFAQLCATPMQLCPTLLVEHVPVNRTTKALLRSSSDRGLFLAKSGDFHNLQFAKVLSFDDEVEDPIAENMLRVVLLPEDSPRPILYAKEEKEITEEFQSMLLSYRLRNYTAALNSSFDVPGFTPEARALVQSLGAAVVDHTDLSDELVRLLAPQDEAARIRRSAHVEFNIVMVLLALVHERKLRNLRVTEISQFVNAALYANGEFREYSPKEIGWRLAGLGLNTHRMPEGKAVVLDRDLSRNVHKLARRLGVALSPPVSPQCRDCQESMKSADKQRLCSLCHS